MSLLQWGILDILPPRTLIEPQAPMIPYVQDRRMFSAHSKSGQYLKIAGIEFEVRQILVFLRGLIGKETWIIRIQSLDANRKTYILKLSCQVCSRVPERSFIDAARAYVAGHPGYNRVLDHLSVIHSREDIPINAIDFASSFGGAEIGVKARVMRAIVYEKLHPISRLTDPECVFQHNEMYESAHF
uniref:Uncharacterized protein n=1 Tax=Moniliophthora roreri TaxID=221103 RepID=A0A0W0GF15_MONRR